MNRRGGDHRGLKTPAPQSRCQQQPAGGRSSRGVGPHASGRGWGPAAQQRNADGRPVTIRHARTFSPAQLVLLEVIVQSVADAAEAEAGGADRLEVVREIERDGLTPPLDLVRSIIAATSLPLRVMVRESDGFEHHPPA